MAAGLPNDVSAMLGALGALIAPSVLVSATAQFISSSAARLALTSDRLRVLSGRMKKVEHSPGQVERSASQLAEERARLQAQLLNYQRRVRAQQHALVLFYTAAVCFVFCSLSLGIEVSLLVLPPWLPVIFGLVGVVLLLIACSMLVLETRALVRTMEEPAPSQQPPAPR